MKIILQGVALSVLQLSLACNVSAAPTETELHTFDGSDGSNPYAGLIVDSKGNLYGTASAYNPDWGGYGTVFELSPPDTAGGTWTETVLHAFTGGSDGAFPVAGLIADSKGNLYGRATTEMNPKLVSSPIARVISTGRRFM